MIRWPQPVENLYANLENRRSKVQLTAQPCDQQLTWPEEFQNLNGVVSWLGETLFGDKNFFYTLDRFGKECVVVPQDALDRHHAACKAGKPHLRVWQKTNQKTFEPSYYCITVMNAGKQYNPAVIELHRLLCWWCYGNPEPNQPIACHYYCDNAACLCVRHLR